jgi:hypothetical protein
VLIVVQEGGDGFVSLRRGQLVPHHVEADAEVGVEPPVLVAVGHAGPLLSKDGQEAEGCVPVLGFPGRVVQDRGGLAVSRTLFVALVGRLHSLGPEGFLPSGPGAVSRGVSRAKLVDERRCQPHAGVRIRQLDGRCVVRAEGQHVGGRPEAVLFAAQGDLVARVGLEVSQDDGPQGGPAVGGCDAELFSVALVECRLKPLLGRDLPWRRAVRDGELETPLVVVRRVERKPSAVGAHVLDAQVGHWATSRGGGEVGVAGVSGPVPIRVRLVGVVDVGAEVRVLGDAVTVWVGMPVGAEPDLLCGEPAESSGARRSRARTTGARGSAGPTGPTGPAGALPSITTTPQ